MEFHEYTRGEWIEGPDVLLPMRREHVLVFILPAAAEIGPGLFEIISRVNDAEFLEVDGGHLVVDRVAVDVVCPAPEVGAGPEQISAAARFRNWRLAFHMIEQATPWNEYLELIGGGKGRRKRTNTHTAADFAGFFGSPWFPLTQPTSQSAG